MAYLERTQEEVDKAEKYNVRYGDRLCLDETLRLCSRQARKHKALHRACRDEAKARRQEEGAARKQVLHRANRDEELPMTRQDAQVRKHGKEMDAAARSKAIKDATMNGVFQAGAYASNLEAEKARRDAQNERMVNKMMRIEKEEEVRWQEQQKAAEKKMKTEDLQAGYAAYYAAMRQGEQEARAAQEEENWWDKAGDWLSDQADNLSNIVTSTWSALKIKDLRFTKLESGQISVSANRPAGTRLDYKVSVVDEGFEFAGTKYNPSTVGNITSKGLLKSAVSKGALALTGLVAFGSNMWEFGKDEEFGSPEYWDATVKNREFWVSTGVDFGVSVLVGLAAAGVVAASIAGFVALGVTAAATAPLWAVVGITVIVGIFIGMGVDALGIPKMAKTWLNGLFTNP